MKHLNSNKHFRMLTPLYVIAVYASMMAHCSGSSITTRTTEDPPKTQQETSQTKDTVVEPVSEERIASLCKKMASSSHGHGWLRTYFSEAEQAAAELAELGENGSSVLFEVIETSGHFGIACKHIWKNDDPKVVPFLNEMLGVYDDSLKEMWIRMALMKMNVDYEDHMKRFKQVLYTSPNPKVDGHVLLENGDKAYVIGETAKILGYVGTEDAVNLIVESLNKSRREVVSFVTALANTKHPTASIALIDLFENPEKFHLPDESHTRRGQIAVIYALSECGGETAFQFMYDIASNQAHPLRKQAASALEHAPATDSDKFIEKHPLPVDSI